METKEPLRLWELGRLVESLALTLKPEPGECPALRRLPEKVKITNARKEGILAKGTAICISNFFNDEPYICQNKKYI